MKYIDFLKQRYREPVILLKQLVITDFKLRYKGSALGYVWSLLRPLLLFLILYFVFAVIFKVGKEIPNYPIYLLLGIVLWNFFSETTQQGLGSVVARGDLIRKVQIPRWLIVVSASVSALINLFLNLIVVIIFAVIYGADFMWSSLLLPVYIVELYVFALGVSFILATYYVKFRDVSYIWDVVIQAGFYATPILYPLTIVTNDLVQKLLILSPIAQAMQGARSVVVTPASLTISEIWAAWYMIALPIVFVGVTFIYGAFLFRKESKYFAENL